MAIKVQPPVIDEAVLDLIGNEFKFDHAKGIAEWLKNSSDAYLRQSIADDKQLIIVRLTEKGPGQLTRIECIDFVGMDKKQIDDAFKRFFDPRAAKKGAKEATIKTLGGHGNGGKFYMRQMFKTSEVITYRNGKLNIFGFNTQKQYGFESGFEEKKMARVEAMNKAGIGGILIPDELEGALLTRETGFTVVRGEMPRKVKGTTERNKLVEKLVFHPQARRLIGQKQVMVLFGNETQPSRLSPPKLEPKEGFEHLVILQVPETVEWQGKPIAFISNQFSWPGRLTLRTSKDPLRGERATLNTIDFIGEVGVIGSYRLHELGPTRFSGQTEFIYGECECPILEDPDDDCVRNDRQRLIEDNEKSQAILAWVRDCVEDLSEKMEDKNTQDKKKQDMKNTSVFNEMLNRWKDRFMDQIWAEVFVGHGPAGSAGAGPGGGSGEKERCELDAGTEKPGKVQEGGSEKKKKPRFPQVLISGQDADLLDPLATEPFQCDPRQPPIYQRFKDVEAGIYWINTSRPLAEKIISEYTADSTRWREYLFQRYIDIIVREGIFQLERIDTSLSADTVVRKIDDLTSRIQDQAARDLDSFLFEEQFGIGK